MVAWENERGWRAVAASLFATLVLTLPAAAGGQGIDVYDLVRQLLAKRSPAGAEASKGIRLEDRASSSVARMRLLSEGGETILLVIELPAGPERLYPHTLRLDVDGSSSSLRILELQESRDASEPEVVVGLVPEERLSAITEARSVTVFLQGWDRSFSADLKDKDLDKIRAFEQKRSATR